MMYMHMHDVCYHTKNVSIYTGKNRDIHYTMVIANTCGTVEAWDANGKVCKKE